jgi:hypothetical protein
MLETLIPPLELITDDDETILFNEVCVRPLSFHLFALMSGVSMSLVLLLISPLTSFLSLHINNWSEFIKYPLAVKIQFYIIVFFKLFAETATKFGIIYILGGFTFFFALEVLLALFPTQIIVTNKRVILNSYSKMIRNVELPLAHIQEFFKMDYTELFYKLNLHSDLKAKHFTLPRVKQIKTIQNLIQEQLDNSNIQNMVIKNPFFKTEKIKQANLIHTSLGLGLSLISYLIVCWLAYYFNPFDKSSP